MGETRIFLAFLVLGLSGCSVGPDDQPPTPALQQSWVGAPTAPAAPVPAAWWRQFEAPELDRLILQGRQSNLDLAVAVARLRQANAQAVIAGAPLLPSVSGGASTERTRDQPSYKQGTNLYSAGLTASYELDFWGGVADQARAAEWAAQASRYDRETADLAVQSAVADSYFSLLSLNQRVALAQANIEAAEHILEAFRARLSVGAASALDLAQQEDLLAEQQAILPPLIEQQRQTRDALAVLVGQLPDQLALPAGDLLSVRLPPVAPGLPADLLTRRPDVQSAEANLRSANQTLKAAVAALFPSITLTAQGGVASEDLSRLFTPAGAFYALTAGITQPIFRDGALQGGRDLAQAQRDQQFAVYRKAVISAFADVEDALVTVSMESRREEAEQRAVNSAHQAYDIAQAQLYNGTIDILTVLNTQRALFADQDALAQARLAHAQAVVSLFKALGGGWQATPEG